MTIGVGIVILHPDGGQWSTDTTDGQTLGYTYTKKL